MNENTKKLFELYGWKLNEDPDTALRRAMQRIDDERFRISRELCDARMNKTKDVRKS